MKTPAKPSPMLHTPLGKVENEGILETVQDFCQMLHWQNSDFLEHTVFNFLEVVMKEDPKSLSLDQLAAPMVLDQKMGKLQDHGFYPICRALKNGDTLEQHAGITLLSFLKKHFAYVRDKAKSPNPYSGVEIDIRTIRQRRTNGDL